MATKQELLVRKQQMTLALMMFFAGALILLGSGYLWFDKVHSNTHHVFWGMVDANLKSFGRTMGVTQNDASRGLNQQQQVRLQLGAQDIAVGKTRLAQNPGTENELAITTESISTPDANYVRYSNVEVANNTVNKDFSGLTKEWAKDANPTSGSSAYVQALFGSLGQVPMGNLSKDQRVELIEYMKEQKVYELQRYHKEVRNGRPVMIYDMGVAMDRYVGMLKKFDEMTGLSQLQGVDPAQFAGQQPMTTNFVVDIASRNLLEFGYASNPQKETYTGYGAYRKVELPSSTITLPELEQRLQTTLFGQ